MQTTLTQILLAIRPHIQHQTIFIFKEALKKMINKNSDAQDFILTSKVRVADGAHQTPK